MNPIEEQWENIKDIIREENELPNIAYKVWIKPLLFYKCEDLDLTIMVPKGNPGILDYCERNAYDDLFEDALFKLTNKHYKVTIVAEENTPESNDDKSVSSNINTLNETENNNEVYTGSSSNLNPKYRFENYVTDPRNSMTMSACLRVAEAPGQDFSYNPLFIYGGSGLGKTHLMNAIGHYIIDNSNLKVLYVTSEQFTNEVIDSIRLGQSGSSHAMTRLRDKYRNIDVLLIDDIQFLIGKPSTQEEFFNTFNALLNSGKSIVITSDKHPKLMKELDERYRSRFNQGLVVDVQPPNYETRMAIIKKYAESMNVNVSNDIIDYIAKNIQSNVRDIEGAFNLIYARMKMNDSEPITLETAKEILKDTISPDRPSIITPSLILEAVSKYYNITPADITSKKRNAEIVLPRQIFMYMCRNMTDTTLQGIATLLDKKDHSTVLHGCKKIEDEIKINQELKETIDLIKNNIITS
ncbi:MAG: chromosomal replication initiator protein DnaA [Lachnospiraceae bacterium]|nr:chromosomal replication initiator protein DnaA [Lachnospiraceae bacterium]